MKLKIEAGINLLVLGWNQQEIGVFGELKENLKIWANSLEVVWRCLNDQVVFCGTLDQQTERLYIGGSEGRIQVMDFGSF